MKTVLFLSKGEDAPSTRYRAFNYFAGLREAGFNPKHQTTTGNLAKKLALLGQISQADMVVINRRTFSSLYTLLIRISAKKLVFDFDDAVFTGSKGEKSNRRRRFIKMLSCCNQVWAGNAYLAEIAKKYNDKVVEIPTAVDTDYYQQEVITPKANTPTLVWIGSSSTKKYLDEVIPILDELASEIDFQLKIIADFTIQTNYLKVIPVQWSAVNEVAEIKACHIGIAPMSDDEWTRGKCALKVLQYLASGLPCVSSAVGANKVIIKESGAGMLASNADEWKSAIKALIANPQQRQELGQQGQQFCQAFYSLAVCQAKMIAALEKL